MNWQETQITICDRYDDSDRPIGQRQVPHHYFRFGDKHQIPGGQPYIFYVSCTETQAAIPEMNLPATWLIEVGGNYNTYIAGTLETAKEKAMQVANLYIHQLKQIVEDFQN